MQVLDQRIQDKNNLIFLCCELTAMVFSVIVSSLISATTGAIVLGAIIIAGQYWKI